MVIELDEEADRQLVETEFGDYVSAELDCAWANGISADFDDTDEDGVPDEDATAFGLYLPLPYDGGTDDGLGLYASMSRFIDAYASRAL